VIETGASEVRGWQINAMAMARPWPLDAGVLKENTLLIYHHHHHISVMELGHLLTRSGLTYPEVSSKVCHDSFCQLGNSVSLPWVIYYEAFYLHVVSSFSCIPVVCLKLVLFLIPFAICVFVFQSVRLYPAVLLMYFISAAVILLASLLKYHGHISPQNWCCF
jgi:hypothetical protein